MKFHFQMGLAATWLNAFFSLLMATSSGAGTLSASFTAMPSNSVVDLTAQGPLDWVHWGLNTEYGFDRKASVAGQIGTMTPIIAGGGQGPYQYGDNFNGYNWSDGSPNSFATNTTTGIYLIGRSSGFQLTVPADTTLRRLKVYVGAFGAQGQFSASLSDNSATAYSDSSVDNLTNGPGGLYTINYASDTPGQHLTITYIVLRQHDNRVGNVTWQAAALAYAASNNPPTATLTSPTNNASFAASAIIKPGVNAGQLISGTIATNATDPNADILTFAKVSGPAWLTVATNGLISGTAANTDAGTNSFVVRVTDPGGLSNSATMTIYVNGAPTFAGNPIIEPGVSVGQPFSGTIATNATDPNGDLLTFSKVSGPGWLNVATNGVLSGTPADTDVGTNSFVVRASDPGGLFDTASMNIVVAAIPKISMAISLHANNLVLSWNGGTAPYQLQVATNLTNPSWDNVGGPIASNSLSITPTNTAAFYRIYGQ